MSNYCNLHLHTQYSLLDGFGTNEAFVEQAVVLGQQAIGITDHGNMSGVIGMKQACEKHGIKLVIGSELYIAPWGKDVHWRPDNKKQAGMSFHLTTWAYNQRGYQNLLKLTQLANKVGFYYRPRIDYAMLAQYSEGLIVTSGCMAGAIPRALNPETGVRAEDYRMVNEIFDYMHSIFGPDRYYIELQDHNIPELREINKEMSRVNDHYGFEYVATNDSHYPTADDAVGQFDVMCISQGCSRFNPSDFVQGYLDHPGYYLTDADQMANKDYGFDAPASAISNTIRVAEMVETINLGYEPEVKRYKFPVMPEYKHNYDGELSTIAFDGFGDMYSAEDNFDAAFDRLKYELSVIKQLGFSSYFLCVYDIKQFCDREGIPMTVRGSAGGSIVLYCLGITDFCPLEYGLLFERFLNPDRVSAPDADLDIDPSRRAEVIKYLIEKYGEDYVAQVVNFNYIKGRGSIRDATRLNEANYDIGDAIVVRMGDDLKITVKEAMSETSIYYIKDLAQSPLDERIIETAQRVEGQIRTVGIHAGAVILSDRPLVEDYPMMRPKSNSKAITNLLVGVNYEAAEQLGGIKLDILGVEALGILYEAIEIINRRYDTSYTFSNIPVDDPVSFDMINSGHLAEIFQLSGHTARAVTAQIKPQNVRDVMAINALARPGPLQYTELFASRMRGEVEVEYKHPNLAEVLAETQGIMIYQEQVMRISQLIAGFSGGEADILRKAVSKKRGFDKIKIQFLTGVHEEGYEKDFAEELWDDILQFAGYGFNASHACAYSRIAVKLAYLKAKYTIEFYAAALTGRGKNEDKLDELLKEMRYFGIELLPPRLGKSDPITFSIDDEVNGVRYPYGSVKNVGKAGNHLKNIKTTSIKAIASEDLKLFKKSGKRALESLAMVGALDHLFDGDRNEAIFSVEYLSKGIVPVRQMSYLPEERINFTKAEFFAFERELTGLYLTGHPLDGYTQKQPSFADKSYEDRNGEVGLFIGVVNSIRLHRDRSSNLMAFVSIEDRNYNLMSVVVFSSLYADLHDYICQGCVIKVLGRINVRHSKDPEEEAKLNKYGRVSIIAQNIIGE